MSNTQLLINCRTFQPEGLCQLLICKQLTKTFGWKRPAVDWLIVAYCSSVTFTIINATMSLYSINIAYLRRGEQARPNRWCHTEPRSNKWELHMHAHKDLQAQVLLWLVQSFSTNRLQRFPQACMHNFLSHIYRHILLIPTCYKFIISNFLTFALPHTFTHTMNTQTHVLSCSYTTKCIISKRTHYKIITANVTRKP